MHKIPCIAYQKTDEVTGSLASLFVICGSTLLQGHILPELSLINFNI
jgi:hypothetical protein